MNRKTERKYFGHGFGNTPPKYIEKCGYTLIPNKNYGLCDILPHDATSNAILAQYRGYDTRLLSEFLEQEIEFYGDEESSTEVA